MEWRTKDAFLERKKKSSVSINAEKTNNAPNNFERFKVPIWGMMVMFNMYRYTSVVQFVDSRYMKR